MWSNGQDLSIGGGRGNSLTIANGGAVYDVNGSLTGCGPVAVLVTGPGSVWNNSGSLDMGTGMTCNGNSLTISNGGAVYDDTSSLGGYYSHVLVTGEGSVWSNGQDLTIWGNGGNGMTISNGGAAYDVNGSIGTASIQDGPNRVLVTGAGSVWNNSGGLSMWAGVMFDSYGVSLTISDGGAVYSASGSLGNFYSQVLVTGTGSVWRVGPISMSSGGNSLTVSDGGAVFASSVSSAYATTVSGGGLYITNGLGTGLLQINQGTLTLNGGTVTVDSFFASNAVNGVVAFSSGLFGSGGTVVTNGQSFVVGDGTDAATFQLNGGVHSFANNLEIRANAFLTGCGTVTGNVVVDPGGTVLANCGGTLTFTGMVTNNGTMRAIEGTTLEAYGSVLNNGTIDLINGGTNFHGAFMNHGTVLGTSSVKISQASKSGQNIVIQIPSVVGHTYQLQFTPSLKPANWTNTGASQSGTGGVLTFTDPGGATNSPSRFYRVDCTAP